MEADIITVVSIGEVIEERIGLSSVVFAAPPIYVLSSGVLHSENRKGRAESGTC